MLLALIYLLSTLLAPAPVAGITVIHTNPDQSIQTVIHLLNSDPRYDDFVVTVQRPAESRITVLPPECTAALVCALHAPRGAIQSITVTLALDLPFVCGARRTYDLAVSARVLTDTATFARTTVGGVLVRECLERVYVP